MILTLDATLYCTLYPWNGCFIAHSLSDSET